MSDIRSIPLVIRGEIIEDDMVTHAGRIGGLRFQTPDVSKHLQKLALADCDALSDLYALSLDQIIDFLEEVGTRLVLSKNPYMRESYEVAKLASNLPESILCYIYEERLTDMLSRNFIEDMIEAQLGRACLEGWVAHTHTDGHVVRHRAFGSRIATIIPGNVPMAAVTQLIRGAVTRSDTIFKMPSNDPATASAVLRTLVDIDPKHPVTRHFSAAYWKGGDESVEAVLYRPQFIDKLIVWGGDASIRHARKYLQPGLHVIPFDPKYSNSIIGREALESDGMMREAAKRLASDVGGLNQEGCVCSRVAYVECGTSKPDIERLNMFGVMVYEALQELPSNISTIAKIDHPGLMESIESLELFEDDFRVIGCTNRLGGVIVSQSDNTVDFQASLEGRIANIVPVASLEVAVRRLNAYSQTVGVFPEAIRATVRDRAPLFGAQRIVSLGYAIAFSVGNRIDAVEPLRQMCRWAIDETFDPAVQAPPWALNSSTQQTKPETALQSA